MRTGVTWHSSCSSGSTPWRQEVGISRRGLTALAIVAAALVLLSVILMAAGMASGLAISAHGGFGFPFGFPPLAWGLMVAGMALGGLGIVAFILVVVLVLVHASSPHTQ